MAWKTPSGRVTIKGRNAFGARVLGMLSVSVCKVLPCQAEIPGFPPGSCLAEMLTKLLRDPTDPH
eukprot:745921-Hanusia_phi.AAC.2